MKVSKIAAICILVIVFSFSVGVSLLSAAPDMTTDEFKAQIKGKIDFYSYPRLSKINGWARDTNFLQYFDANTKYVIYLYLNGDFSVSDVEFRRYESSEETILDSVAQDALKKLEYTVQVPTLTEIVVSPPVATLHVGATVEFKATAYNQNGEVMGGVTVTWSSSEPSVGTIDANNGLFTAKKVGETTIVAESGDIRGTASVRVTEPYIPTPALSAIEVLPPAATLNVGATVEFKATAYDQNGKEMKGVTATWSSTDSSVGTIDANNGLFTAKKVGGTTIVAKSGDIRGTASVRVTEPYIPTPALSAIEVLPPAATLNVGATVEFKAIAYDQNGKEMSGVTVTWSSTDSSVGTIDANNGLFTAKKVGETTIVAKSGDKGGPASVRVTEPYIPTPAPSLSRIDVSPPAATLNVGATVEFKAIAYDQNGKEMSGVTVTWSSTDSSVGTIDANGLFAAKKVGETTIVAKSGDIRGPASVRVTEPYIPTPAPSLSRIDVSPPAATLKVDATVEFKATAYNQNGEVMSGVTVTWSSTDSSVGTIDANNGLFTAKKVGETTIVAKSGDKGGPASVRVTEPYIPTPAPSLSRIDVSPPAVTLKVDATVEFKATAYNQNGEVMSGVTVTWSSTDSSVGTIDANGLFTATKVGETTIVAKSGDIRGPASVRVTESYIPTPAPSLSRIDVLPSAATLKVDATVEFKATAYNQNGEVMSGVTVTWSSTDSSVGTIDANGLFTATKVGETTIVAKSGDMRGTASVRVTESYIPTPAPSLSRIDVLPSAAALQVGATVEFKATAYNQNGEVMRGVTVTWSSTDSSVGTIDANGLFTAKKVGGTTIVAESGDIRGTASVMIPALSAIEVSPSAATLKVGDTMEFKATAYDQNHKEMRGVTVTWSSSEPSVGTIDANGLFTAKKVGETAIVAKSGDIRGNASVRVTEPYIPTPVPSLSAIEVLPPAAETLKVGDKMEFNAIAYDQYGKEMKGVTVTWSSSEPSVGTIDANGLFTAKKVGETAIVAKSGDIRGNASVSVILRETRYPPRSENIIGGNVSFNKYDGNASLIIKTVEFHNDTVSGSVSLTRYNPSFLIDIAVPEELRNSSGKIIFRLYEEDMKTWSSDRASQIFSAFDRILDQTPIFSLYDFIKEDVKLLHESGGGWTELPTKSTLDYTNGSDRYWQFEAYTPNFSRFIVKMEKRPVTGIFFVACISVLVGLFTALRSELSNVKSKKKWTKIISTYPCLKKLFPIITIAVIFVIIGILFWQFLMLIVLIALIVIPSWKRHKEKKRYAAVKILNVEQENDEDEKKTKATITIKESDKSYDLKVEKENGKQNILRSLSTFIRTYSPSFTYFPSFHNVLVIVLTIVLVGILWLLSIFLAYLF